MIMRDMKWECPECGARLTAASGCKFCPCCGYGQCGKWEALKTGLSFMLLVVLTSLCGWCTIDKYDDASPIPHLTNEQIKDHTKKQLEAQEIKDKKEMEAQSR